MAINPRLISKNNPYQFMPTPTGLRRARKDFLCRLFDLVTAASRENIMLSSDDCSFILNSTKRGYERVATPRILGKHLAYLHAKGVMGRFEFKSKEFASTFGKKAYYIPTENENGKWYRADYPTVTRDDDGQWTIKASKPMETRDIQEQ